MKLKLTARGLLIMGCFAFVLRLGAASREAEWKKVEEAVEKGLPKTAIESLEPIIAGALQDQAYAEAVKAMARKIVLHGTIEGNKPEEKIVLLEEAMRTAPEPMVPVLNTILAHWYWHYFQQNRWRFLGRTATGEAPGDDFTTWDLPRLFARIDDHFTKALSAPQWLKDTPVATFDDLLIRGTLPDAYRPTMYDFIAHEALAFYTSGEQAAAQPEDAFVLEADSPILGTVRDFLDWPPLTMEIERAGDTNSPVLQAIDLFQALLAFHQDDPDPTAFLDVNLERLRYGFNVAVGDSKSERYRAALERFADSQAGHPLSALALYRWAELLRGDGDLVQAHALATRGLASHPESPGGRQCRNLLSQIEAKSIDLLTERVWNEPWPKITLRYRNLTQVHFRAVRARWDDYLNRTRNRPDRLNQNERQALLREAPVLTWSETLPATEDYAERVATFEAPKALSKGFYFIMASPDPDFSAENNRMSYTDIWVSDLALVMRPRNGRLEGFVLNALSGEPIFGAEVNAWYLDRDRTRVSVPATKSDDLGFFSFEPGGERNRGHLVRVRHGGDTLATDQEYRAYPTSEADPHSRTFFFTDRGLYRPGQTVRYKGLCLNVNTAQDDYRLLPGQKVSVIFADPNGKEVSRHEHRCNEYGSFHGSVTAPSGRVNGGYSLRVDTGPDGSAFFQVEEYKRPKFKVTLKAPETAPKLDDQVELQGIAEAYTGAAIDGAAVRWRVVREVRWPYWWGWRYPWRLRNSSSSQEIAHGMARTEANGTFKISFLSKPDPAVSEDDGEGVSFAFRVHADVIDATGETRSDERLVQVGFVALAAQLTASTWQTSTQAVELSLRTTTLDGEPQSAPGMLTVYRLVPPEEVHRSRMGEMSDYFPGPAKEGEPDLSNPENWREGEEVFREDVRTDATGQAKLEVRLDVGVYRAVFTTQDRFGKSLKVPRLVQVLEPAAPQLSLRLPSLFESPRWSVEPGTEFMALWGTGYERGRAFIEIEHRHRMVQRFWTQPGRTQQQIKQAVTEAMRGGFHVHVTQVRENRAYLSTRKVEVPWSNKDLVLRWEHFVSKLEPGRKETWSLIIEPASTSEGNESPSGVAAELVAALYDESLDQFRDHAWMRQLGVFYQDQTTGHGRFENMTAHFRHLLGGWTTSHIDVNRTYRSFPHELTVNVWRYGWAANFGLSRGGVAMPVPKSASPARAFALGEAAADSFGFGAALAEEGNMSLGRQAPRAEAGAAPQPGIGPDLDQISARKNLQETAFFFPQMRADSNGVVKLEFTMPEALTQWKFMAFAHDAQLRSGFLQDHAVTSKDIMVQPNPPRFLREGDLLEFTVKISNQSAARQSGLVRLSFNFARSGESADAALGNTESEVPFDVPAQASQSYAWRIQVPDGCGFLTYRAVASTGKLSDGEEGYLPVLSRRVFVTESLPLPMRGPGRKTFSFAKLIESAQSDSLSHESLTVQMVSHPIWYAVLALPYLMEYPHECSEQIFNRLYANTLARHIAQSDPKIRRIFDQWKNTPALDSPLEKNQELKAVMLEETPWLRQAKSESEARRNVGVLFDDNRLEDETQRALGQLTETQLGDGSWPWFPGGRGNDYITLYIATGFGRLRHLGAEVPVDAAVRSWQRLDGWMQTRYERVLERAKPEDYVPNPTDALYLYGRSFFLKDQPVTPQHLSAIRFFLARAHDHWLKTNHRQTQGHLALAVHRFHLGRIIEDDETPRAIMASLKERSVTDEELGMFWRDTELSWWWYRAPIETQALMIEAFDEVVGDRAAVEACQVWLLKQKQTQDWKTTKATADAVYALLLRGTDALSKDALVRVSVGGIDITPGRESDSGPSPTNRRSSSDPAVEPGTGFYEHTFEASSITPELGRVTVTKVDDGVSWGSVHWQYFEDMSQLTPHEGTPLQLRKRLYTKVNTKRGPELQAVEGPIAVGDELVVRLELRTDRDMEYVHLKDQRGSGTEPVNVLSGYRFQDGLAYYEITRDTASHFFIDYLPKGVYVFEYSTRVQHRGQYQSGMAEIQCMYAPEFNSHSESWPLEVR